MRSVAYRALWAVSIGLVNFNVGYYLNEIGQIWEFTPGIFDFIYDQKESRNLALLLTGTFFGAAVSLTSWYFMRFGKRRLLMIGDFIIIFASVIIWANNYFILLLSRLLYGVAFGIVSSTVPMFINELSETKHKGPMLTIPSIFISLGMFVGLLMGQALPKLENDESQSMSKTGKDIKGYIAWREILSFPILVGLLHLFLLFFVFRNENPKYVRQRESFISNYTPLEYETAESNFGKTEQSVTVSTLSAPSLNIGEEKDTFTNLLSAKGRRALTAGCIVHALVQLTGINMVFTYTYYFPVAIEGGNLDLRIVITGLNTFCLLIGAYFMKIYDRRPLFLIGCIVSGAGNCIIFQIFDSPNGQESHTFEEFMSVLLVILFTVGFALTIGPLSWVYSSEVLSEKGMAIATSIHWIFNGVVAYLPSLAGSLSKNRESGHEADYAAIFFFIFSGLSMLGFFLVLVFIKETRNIDGALVLKEFYGKTFDTMTIKGRLNSTSQIGAY